jgi:ubiquinone/menaquinone biosynthesis C-methylase UbiE
MSSYNRILSDRNRFYYKNGIFYQKGTIINSSFEESYLKIRKKEGRVYDDEIARSLPSFHGKEPLVTEWEIRKQSAQRLVNYFKARQPLCIIEIGCGNGWLTRYLYHHIKGEYCGIDINEYELQQAARISNTSICFLYGDILSEATNNLRADIIIIASALQYFADTKSLIQKMFFHLTPKGEIHIIDTPFYKDKQIELAMERSKNYFSTLGLLPEQGNYYHHHWNSLQPFNHKIIYHPNHILNKTKRFFFKGSPFPWVIIKND